MGRPVPLGAPMSISFRFCRSPGPKTYIVPYTDKDFPKESYWSEPEKRLSRFITKRYTLRQCLVGVTSVLRPFFYFKIFPKGNTIRVLAALGSLTLYVDW